jgi:hypothetical protein
MVEYRKNTIFLENDWKKRPFPYFFYHFRFCYFDNCFHFYLSLKVDKISKIILKKLKNTVFVLIPTRRGSESHENRKLTELTSNRSTEFLNGHAQGPYTGLVLHTDNGLEVMDAALQEG